MRSSEIERIFAFTGSVWAIGTPVAVVIAAKITRRNYLDCMAGRLFVFARTAVVSTLFVSIWVWFVPRWIAAGKHVRLEPQLRAFPAVLMAIGATTMLWCVWEFAWTGRGTPAPFDPPR